jgi:TonB family protein
MASVTTSDFVATATNSGAPPFSLIEQKSLLARLAEELARTSHEFARDPRSFIRDLFADDTKDAKRRRRIYFGLAGALVIHAVLLMVIVVIGWRSLTASEAAPKVILLEPPTKISTKEEEPKTDIPRGKKDAGGGHGGETHSPPATKGPLPQSSPQPQTVKLTAPSRPLPSLPVQATVVGPDSPPPAVNVQPGIPNGTIAEAPAPGEGPRGGLGGGLDTGAGTDKGNGAGSGRDGGRGTTAGNVGLPNGKNIITGPIPFNRLKDMPGNRGITWIRRPYPITTPEAQANKYRGEVWLKATFNADGTITDIEVVHEVPYGMTESAIDALKRSRFNPATINGQPVTLVNVPVRINIITELQ